MKIIIYAGDSWEAWSPKSVSKGLGGSEEAVINMGFELARIGHDVTVYNRHEENQERYYVEGGTATYENGVLKGTETRYSSFVTYKDYLDYDGEECDVFVGWRNINCWKVARNFKAGYHWLHDTSPEESVMQAIDWGCQKVMVLSDYHRRLYPRINGGYMYKTRNGIVPSQFEKDVTRVPGRLFYGSSYDRGLDKLLEVWPEIKLANPDATLHVAYGFETMEKVMKQKDDGTFERVRDNLLELMDQEGVTHLGRISHEEVAKEMLEADIWAYPTWWPETSCITAMKAQAAGAIPCVIPTAALAETVRIGLKTDRGYYHDLSGNVVEPEEALPQFVANVNALLEMDEEAKKPMRDAMRQDAKAYFAWSEVAREWDTEFTKQLQKNA